MSIVNIFEEELEIVLRQIGLSIDDIVNYETRDNGLVLYLKNGHQVRINHPYLARLAEAKTNEEIIAHTVPKKNLLARLYMLENIFVGKIKWEDFLDKYVSYTSQEIFRRIRELEENNSKYMPKLKECAKALIAYALANNDSCYPIGIDDSLSTRTLQELAEIYIRVSAGKISIRDLRELCNSYKK